MGDWLTVREAARVAGVDGDTIRRWANSGRLTHQRTAGGHRRIDADVLAELLTGATPPRPGEAHVPPYDAVEYCAAQADDWLGWVPPHHLGDDYLAELRLTIQGSGDGGLIGALRALVGSISAELARRDIAATSPTGPAPTAPGSSPSASGDPLGLYDTDPTTALPTSEPADSERLDDNTAWRGAGGGVGRT